MKIFAERLKDLREDARLSQTELAKAVNLGQTTISHWELNERVPNAEAVVKFAKFFNVSADYLLGLID
jgi:transcriptional regulator with XRE-family HTH domain